LSKTRRRRVRAQISEEGPPAFDRSVLRGGRFPIAASIQTLAVTEYRNVRRAATPFGLCPSDVRTLQKDLSVGLFERHACDVTLAEAGEL
jgi:hypothetical protein